MFTLSRPIALCQVDDELRPILAMAAARFPVTSAKLRNELHLYACEAVGGIPYAAWRPGTGLLPVTAAHDSITRFLADINDRLFPRRILHVTSSTALPAADVGTEKSFTRIGAAMTSRYGGRIYGIMLFSMPTGIRISCLLTDKDGPEIPEIHIG